MSDQNEKRRFFFKDRPDDRNVGVGIVVRKIRMISRDDAIDLPGLEFVRERRRPGAENDGCDLPSEIPGGALGKDEQFGSDWFEFLARVFGYDENH